MRFVELLKEKYVLVMSLPQNSAELAEAAVKAGADVLKVHINVEHRASKTLFKSLEEESESLKKILKLAAGRPCGIVPGGSVDFPVEELYGVYEMGFDFISLYAHHTRAEVLDYSKVSRMLAVDYTYSGSMVRTLESLNADVLEASIMHPEEYGAPLVLSDLMKYRVLRENSSLPIIVPSQKHILPSHVKRLKDIGTNGIMIGSVVTGRDSESIYRAVSAFRKSIDEEAG